MRRYRRVIVVAALAVFGLSSCGGGSSGSPSGTQPTDTSAVVVLSTSASPVVSTDLVDQGTALPAHLSAVVQLDGRLVSGRAILSTVSSDRSEFVVELDPVDGDLGDELGVVVLAATCSDPGNWMTGPVLAKLVVATADLDRSPVAFDVLPTTTAPHIILLTNKAGDAPYACGVLSDPAPVPTAVPTTTLGEWTIGEADASEAPTTDDAEASAGELGSDGVPVDQGEITSDADSAVDVDPDVDEPDVDVDPCGLVTAQEWADWVGVDVAHTTTMYLEHGTACGFVTVADEVRMALAVIPTGDPWIPAEVTSNGVNVDRRAWGLWASGYPVPESSTLAVPISETVQIVIEISAIVEIGEADLQDAAARFAGLAWSRLG